MAAKEMKRTVESILKSHGRLEEFTSSDDFHLRLDNSPYMPLVIERHGQEVTITHYFEQNGDLVPDPDMSFEIGADGEWYPMAIQFSNGMYRVAVEYCDGRRAVNPREMKEQTMFARFWARNLKAQGYARPPEASAATDHE